MVVGSDKKGQDKRQICEMDRKNCKARRQTSECKAMLYGHLKGKEEGYVGKRMMEMAVPGRRKRGSPRRRWMDLARDNLERVGAKGGDKIDRVKWKILLRCGDPRYGEAERRRRSCFNNIDLKKKGFRGTLPSAIALQRNCSYKQQGL